MAATPTGHWRRDLKRHLALYTLVLLVVGCLVGTHPAAGEAADTGQGTPAPVSGEADDAPWEPPGSAANAASSDRADADVGAPAAPAPAAPPALPEPDPEGRRLIVDSFTRYYLGPQGEVEAEGVAARWRTYRITARRVSGSSKTGRYVFEDDVTLTDDSLHVTGSRLVVEARTRRWTMDRANTRMAPQFLENRITSDLFLTGESMTGQQRRAEWGVSSCTTCDREHPHYDFYARQADLVTGKRLVLRHVRFNAWGHTLMTLPALVIPLDQRRNEGVTPELGQSVEEGYYAKLAVGYMLGEQAGIGRLHLMEKRGVGVGTEQQYRLGDGQGVFSAFYLNDHRRKAQSLDMSLRHRQNLFGFQTDITGDLRSASYLFTGESRSSNWALNLSRSTPMQSLSTAVRYSENAGSGFHSDSLSGAVRWDTRFGQNNRLSINSDYSSTGYSGGVNNRMEQVLTQTTLSGTTTLLDWNMATFHRIPISSGTGYGYGGLEKQPEVTLRTDGARLWGGPRTIRLMAVAGDYRELPSGRGIRQARFEAQTQAGGAQGFSYSALFRQGFASDDSAQYVLQVTASLRSGLGSIDYRYSRPHGYAPLRTDYSGQYNYLSGGLTLGKPQVLSFRAYTGYDLLAEKRRQDGWHPLNMDLNWTPFSGLQASFQSTLAPSNGRWEYLRGRMRYRNGENQLLLSGLYNPVLSKLANATGYVDMEINPAWRIEALGVYNGYTRRFESRQMMLVRNWHCWEACVGYIENKTGYRAGAQWVVEMRIKAFPGRRRIGYGDSGDALYGGGYGGWSQGGEPNPGDY